LRFISLILQFLWHFSHSDALHAASRYCHIMSLVVPEGVGMWRSLTDVNLCTDFDAAYCTMLPCCDHRRQPIGVHGVRTPPVFDRVVSTYMWTPPEFVTTER